MQIEDVLGLACADAALRGLVLDVVVEQAAQRVRGARRRGLLFGDVLPALDGFRLVDVSC